MQGVRRTEGCEATRASQRNWRLCVQARAGSLCEGSPGGGRRGVLLAQAQANRTSAENVGAEADMEFDCGVMVRAPRRRLFSEAPTRGLYWYSTVEAEVGVGRVGFEKSVVRVCLLVQDPSRKARGGSTERGLARAGTRKRRFTPIIYF